MKAEVQIILPSNVSNEDASACLALIRNGGAVNANIAEEQFPQAELVAICRETQEIAAVGVIKRKRPEYATGISFKAGFTFDSNINEIGYISVSKDHQGHGLSERIVEGLLSAFPSLPFFATASHPAMKRTLEKFGFIQQGKEWQGNRGDWLSLWIKTTT